jgi:hypothetical protein
MARNDLLTILFTGQKTGAFRPRFYRPAKAGQKCFSDQKMDGGETVATAMAAQRSEKPENKGVLKARGRSKRSLFPMVRACINIARKSGERFLVKRRKTNDNNVLTVVRKLFTIENYPENRGFLNAERKKRAPRTRSALVKNS